MANAKKKPMLVKDILGLFDKDQPIDVHCYAYGVFVGASRSTGVLTAGECLERLIYEALNAAVTSIRNARECSDPNCIVIRAEMVHN